MRTAPVSIERISLLRTPIIDLPHSVTTRKMNRAHLKNMCSYSKFKTKTSRKNWMSLFELKKFWSAILTEVLASSKFNNDLLSPFLSATIKSVRVSLLEGNSLWMRPSLLFWTLGTWWDKWMTQVFRRGRLTKFKSSHVQWCLRVTALSALTTTGPATLLSAVD